MTKDIAILGGAALDNIITEISTKETKLDVSPYPEPNQIVYTTTDGEAIEIDDSNIISNVYYKDKGYGVIDLKDDICPSFEGILNIKTVHIANNIKLTAHRLFRDCNNLQKAILPNNINAIPSQIFYNCISLKEVNIPEGVTILNSECFRNCTSLTSIILPNSLENISGYAMFGCTNLSFINFPENLVTIGDAAFTNNGLISIVLPKNITTLGQILFENCKNLNHISILSNNITEIPSFFCQNCTNLKTVKLPNSIISMGGDVFRNCNNIKEINIPSKIETIGRATCFGGEIDMNNLVIPATYKSGIISNFAPYTLDWYPNFIPELNSNRPNIKNIKTLILRSSTLVEDVDTYIGTPNNWLKIYVPSGILKKYQERYPTLKNYLHPITGEDIYALKDDVDLSNVVTFDDVATSLKDGIMSASDKDKLNKIINYITSIQVTARDKNSVELTYQIQSPTSNMVNIKYVELEEASETQAGVLSATDKSKINTLYKEQVVSTTEYENIKYKDNNTLYIILDDEDATT